MSGTKRLMALGAVLALMLWAAASAYATKPTREPNLIPTQDFPAGTACEGFPLRVAADVNTQHQTTFLDKQGNPVRAVITGRLIITLTNLDQPERSVTLRLGDALHLIFNADGSTTLVGTGRVVQVRFPTDSPPGPSTTLYTGRLTTTISSAGDFTSLGFNGKTPLDLCAALSA